MAGAKRRREAGWVTAAQAVVDRVFVYGTLRSGQTARSLIGDHVAASERATLAGAMYVMPEGYPAVIPGGEGTVQGELVTLRDLAAAFLLLDAYEGDGYRRVLARARRGDGSDCWAWVYTLADPATADRAELIEHGDWARYLTA